MWKIIMMICTGIIVSFYYFPFEFSFMPGVNTKMAMAIMGAIVCIYKLINKNEFTTSRAVILLFLWAGIVSIVGVASIAYNSTQDFTYARYIISMSVWLSAAFFVCNIIKCVHDEISIRVLINYLIVVAVAQCILAQIIQASPDFKTLIDTYIIQGQEFLNESERIYGIGASLDVAGIRFTCVLIMIVALLLNKKEQYTGIQLMLYSFAFVCIIVLGSMIARTTYVGVVVAVFYVILSVRSLTGDLKHRCFKILRIITLLLAVFVPLFIYLYNNSPQIHDLLRFAFEGVFNWVEQGEWSIASNEKLKTMYVFPDNFKTWIIGDGYFDNPTNTDPYYVGKITGGYYMNTDVGYLRFIFYFGIIGLFFFSFFLFTAAYECTKLHPQWEIMCWLILFAGFVIWLKVATDVFLVFALLLCCGIMLVEESTDITADS